MSIRIGPFVTVVVACLFGCAGPKIWNQPPPPSVSFVSTEALMSEGRRRSHLEQQLHRFAVSRDPLTALELARSYSRLAYLKEQSADQAAAAALYYQAAAFGREAWCRGNPGGTDRVEAFELHHRSVARLISAAQRAGRYSASEGVSLCVRGRPIRIPVRSVGFVWRPPDFQQLIPAGFYETKALTIRYYRRGWGVPLVVVRKRPVGNLIEEEFLPSRPVGFAATAVLTPDVEALLPGGECRSNSAALTLYDPLRVPHTVDGVALATDISAPFALASVAEPELWGGAIELFFDTAPAREQGLFFLEPYQRGKIPVVFVHGLASSPQTWVDMVNQLRAIPGFTDRYQVWAFRYATGRPFLESAARLRRAMNRATAMLDGVEHDPALRHVVLVGHSMGGLVSKLQVTDSGDRLWRAVAHRPLDGIVASDAVKARLGEMFYFEAQPRIRRVVFLATPHGGSPLAARPVGRLASRLARSESDQVQLHRALVAANPNVFSPQLSDGIPTSIDMLEQESELLRAIRSLRPAPGVRVHSIIGDGQPILGAGPADGVVPVTSALTDSAETTMFVPATHEHVHRLLESTWEVHRVLNEEYAALRAEHRDHD